MVAQPDENAMIIIPTAHNRKFKYPFSFLRMLPSDYRVPGLGSSFYVTNSMVTSKLIIVSLPRHMANALAHTGGHEFAADVGEMNSI